MYEDWQLFRQCCDMIDSLSLSLSLSLSFSLSPTHSRVESLDAEVLASGFTKEMQQSLDQVSVCL